MTKAWEEEWFAEPFDTDGSVVGATVDGQRFVRLASASRTPWNPDPDAAARLAASAPDMVRALLEIEWRGEDGFRCPACDGADPSFGGGVGGYHDGHRESCAIDAALRKAGLR